MKKIKVPNAPSIRRMPSYLHKLYHMRLEGKSFVSTTELAEHMNTELIVVRKDIALVGLAGQRRIGYHINELISAINEYLGWQDTLTATLIGAGSLGTAILGFDEFSRYGLRIESVFDCDTNKIGRALRGHEIFDVATIRTRLKTAPPDIAILCVSAVTAQLVADQVIAVGIKYIWNFTNVSLTVPDYVIVQKEVLAGGFAMLAVKIKNDRSGDCLPIKE
ncbi:MAG: redox-sensing transcriptional repressor Rex [Thermoguttaceae bacterium]|nr:redox-sensing transcriptional repressor Rex [Thermoguttaceae bacterium]